MMVDGSAVNTRCLAQIIWSCEEFTDLVLSLLTAHRLIVAVLILSNMSDIYDCISTFDRHPGDVDNAATQPLTFKPLRLTLANKLLLQFSLKNRKPMLNQRVSTFIQTACYLLLLFTSAFP